jgi:hypothetical protein
MKGKGRGKLAIAVVGIVVTVLIYAACAQMPVTIRGNVIYANGTGVGKGWPVTVTNLGTGLLLKSTNTTLGSQYTIAVDPSALNVGNTLEAVTQNGSWVGRTTYVVQTGDNVAGMFINMTNITVSINLPPNVTVETLVGTQCGNVTINYTLMDANSDACSIAVQFKGGVHADWTTATVSGQTTGLTSSPGGEAHSIIWQSGSDASGEDALFQVRITPSDGMVVGDANSTAEFEVDNKAPTIAFIDPTPANGVEVQVNYVVINVSIADDDVDTVWLDWNGTILQPGSVGAGAGSSKFVLFATAESIFTFNVTKLTSGEYTYTVYANDTTVCGNIGASEPRTVIVNVTTMEFDLSLVTSWNLISVPLEPVDASLDTIFANASDGDLIYAYHNGSWAISQYYSAYSTWDGDLLSVYLDDGYWYVANTAYTATIEGSEAGPRSVPFVVGWNLIGYSRLTEAALNAMITGCSDGDLIYAYHNGVWAISQYYTTYSTWDGDLTVMKPGSGYWYVANTPFTWEY